MGAHQRVQMVRARLNWDPKVGNPPEGTQEEEEGWEDATEVPVSQDRGEEQLPSSERRQLTTVRDVYHYTDHILLTRVSLELLKVAALHLPSSDCTGVAAEYRQNAGTWII